jgi:hypothetical protein
MLDPNQLEMESYWSDVRPVRLEVLPVELQSPPSKTTGLVLRGEQYVQPGVSISYLRIPGPQLTNSNEYWAHQLGLSATAGHMNLNPPTGTAEELERVLMDHLPVGVSYAQVLRALMARLDGDYRG